MAIQQTRRLSAPISIERAAYVVLSDATVVYRRDIERIAEDRPDVKVVHIYADREPEKPARRVLPELAISHRRNA